MDSVTANQHTNMHTITEEEVNRLLDLGRVLFSVLTPEEIHALQAEFAIFSTKVEKGNTSVS